MLISIEILIDKGFIHDDAQFNCSTSKKVVKLAGFPTMIDYGLIENHLILAEGIIHLQCVSKKWLPFEIQISHNVLNLPDKYNCLESFSES